MTRRALSLKPTEHSEQTAVISLCRQMEGRWPALRLLFAIPNAAKRSYRLANALKAEGMKSGVPDLCLPHPNGRYFGLFVEMKREDGRLSDVSAAQHEWLVALRLEGYRAEVAYGALDAMRIITEYMEAE